MLDALSLEIIWARLIAIVDESATVLMRTSFSPIIRENKDFAVVVLDASGDSMAQSSMSVPAFNGTLPRLARAVLERFPVETWQPGDVVLTNDPWLASGHLPDLNILVPVFYRSRLVAFVGVTAQVPDIGGRGVTTEGRDLYEEGIQIPICRVIEAGRTNQTVIDFLRANVRLPDQVIGDLEGMIASAGVARTRLTELLEEMKLDDYVEVAGEIQRRCEGAMRRALAQTKPGIYPARVELEGLGDPLTICVQIVIDGDHATVDFAGSSPQVAAGINCTFSYTYTYAAYALKCVFSPDIPNNEGAFRPVAMLAPEGTIVNPLRPAPVASRHLVGHYVSTALFQALAKAAPDRVPADSGSPRPMIIFQGDDAEGSHYVNFLLVMGGLGARPDRDGIPCVPFPTNTANNPIEIMEAACPLLLERKEMLTDSGGAGRYLGGCGQEVIVRATAPTTTRVSILAQRTRVAPEGFAGGLPGGLAAFWRNGSQPVGVRGSTVLYLEQGETLTIRSPGGGGFGPPSERPSDRLHADVLDDFVSPEQAQRAYGQKVNKGE